MRLLCPSLPNWVHSFQPRETSVGVTPLALATTAGRLVKRAQRIYRNFVPRRRQPNSGRCLAEGTVVEVIRAERRLVAIMAADIVGYSRLIEAAEASTLSTIRDLRREVIDPLLSVHH